MTREFSVTASLKGAIGETLLVDHKSAIREYFLDWCLDDLQDNNPEWIPESEYHVTFDIDRTPHSYDVSIDGDFATWYPDGLYTLHFEPSRPVRERFTRYSVEYPIEVKTGQSSELTDNQRAVMATIEQQENPLFPLRIRVEISDLPESFTLVPHRIRHTGDTPLPEYSIDESATLPTEFRERDTSLSSFSEDH